MVNEIKQSTSLPIFHAGRITTPEMAEEAISKGMLDVVFMTKSHIADPHILRKVQEGRFDDIRYCTRCLQKCVGDMENLTCVYNPVTSREKTWSELIPATKPKRVIVVGAGPAGMEAALVLHKRGHKVIVLEKSETVGGQVMLAASGNLHKLFIRIAEYYQRQADKGEFEIRYSTEAGKDSILALNPDTVIVATGSRQKNARIPGGREVWSVSEVLTMNLDNIRKVVLEDRTGTMHALIAADYLSMKGIDIEFITPEPRLSSGREVEGMTREEYLSRLKQQGVKFYKEQHLTFWDHEMAIIRNNNFIEESVLKQVDAVVISAGGEAINNLSLQLMGSVPELYTIGDANLPRTVYEATLQGGLIGRTL